MPTISFRSHVLLLSSFIVTAVLLLAVTLPGDSQLIRALQNSGHFLLFALLSLAALWSFRASLDKLLWPVLLSCVLFGIFIEIVQYIIGREASVYDISLNAMGVAAGGILFAGLIRCSLPRGWSLAIVALLLLIAFSKPLYWLLVYQFRSADFPHLINLDRRLVNGLLQGSYGSDIRIVKCPISWPVDFIPSAMHCMLVSLGEGPWPGIVLTEPEPDWRGYHTLELSIYSEMMRPLPLTLRIHDRSHNHQYKDRFNRRLEIKRGLNRFEIPLVEIENAPPARRLDLSAITNVLLYGTKGELGREFYLVSMRLR